MTNSLKIIVLSILSLVTINFYSQGFSFLNTVTSSSSGYQASIRAVKVDQIGNKYIAGNFDISATIKNTTVTGNSKDIFFGKLDSLGNPIWIKTAGGPGSDQAMDVELDNQGGLYISGLFSSTAVFDGDTAVSAFQPFANPINVSDNFLAKYDTSGNFQWIKTGATTDNDFNNISLLSDDIIIAGSAVSDKALSEFAMENSFGGFEFLSCIPGTVGGGIKMNAGCFEREFKDILVSIQAINKSGQVITIPTKDINFRYRDSGLSDDLIFLSASFRGFKKNNSLIKDEMNNLKEKKELAQPTKIKTSGSTFKNPLDQSDKKVWQLIKESVSLEKSFEMPVFQINIVIFL